MNTHHLIISFLAFNATVSLIVNTVYLLLFYSFPSKTKWKVMYQKAKKNLSIKRPSSILYYLWIVFIEPCDLWVKIAKISGGLMAISYIAYLFVLFIF